MFLAILLLPILAVAISDEGIDPFHTDPRIIGRHSPVEVFERLSSASTLIRGKRVPFCFWYDANKWINDSWRYKLDEQLVFHSVANHIDAAIIAELVPTPKKLIRSLVWQNAEWDFDNVKFLREEMRKVNDLNIICYQWSATYKGPDERIKRGREFGFYEYVLADEETTIQIVTSCPLEDFRRLQPEMTEFLNGITSCAYSTPVQD